MQRFSGTKATADSLPAASLHKHCAMLMGINKKTSLMLALLLSVLLTASGATKNFTLVIDAGHGGHDAGAVGKFSKEKDINLSVALSFGQYVERCCPDVKVIYTRKTDVFVPLHERADIANRNKADLFISIHTNALPGGHIARGLETYTLGMHRAKDNLDVAKRENAVILVEKDYKQRYEGFDPNSSESYIMFEFMQDKNMAKSVDLAKYVQRNVCQTASRPDKGVKQAGFLVLRETSMPSCLIELGFISTPDEEQLLNNKTTVDQMGNGIYKAFVQYKEKYNGGTSYPYKAAEKEPGLDVGRIFPSDNETANKPSKTPERQQQAASPTPQQQSKLPSAEREDNTAHPVFKVQIMACDTKVKAGSPLLKGETGVDAYEEGGLWKYTVGSSTDYNEINRLRKSLSEKFPQAFVIAFKNGEKTNVNEAIREFVRNKNKKQ